MSQIQDIRIQSKVDKKEVWETENPILLEREIGYEGDTGGYKIGQLDENNQALRWNDLPYSSVGQFTPDGGEVFNTRHNSSPNSALGMASHAEGYGTSAVGLCSHAEGANTLASGGYAHTEGRETSASGGYGHAEGYKTSAKGTGSHAEGYNSTAISFGSHVSGENNFAGTGAFKIISEFENKRTGIVVLQLNTTKGLEVGQNCTLKVNKEFITGIQIYDIDPRTARIKLSGVPSDALYNTDQGEEATHTIENYLMVHGHPELGDIDVGQNAYSSGYENFAQGRESFATGRGNKVLGQYGFVGGKDNTVGYAAFATGKDNQTLGNYAHAEGFANSATSTATHAEGYLNKASGGYSHVEGYKNEAIGRETHAEGNENKAIGDNSHAEGFKNETTGINSHAEGSTNKTLGNNSHAEGYQTAANGDNSHTEGYATTAGCHKAFTLSKFSSSATDNKEVINTISIRILDQAHYDKIQNYINSIDGNSIKSKIPLYIYDDLNDNDYITSVQIDLKTFTLEEFFVFGTVLYGTFTIISTITETEKEKLMRINDYQSDPTHSTHYYTRSNDNNFNQFADVYADCCHAEGNQTYAKGNYSHAEGDITAALGKVSHAEGHSSRATGDYSHAEGNNAYAQGDYSHAEGSSAVALGDYSHAEGSLTRATGDYSHTEGYGTIASGKESHAEGSEATAFGEVSHAEGYLSCAEGNYSHAEGSGTTASGDGSHAEGFNSTASGLSSHAEGGNKTVAQGTYSHAEGHGTIASGDGGSHAEGNKTQASGAYGSHAEGYLSKAEGYASHAEGNGAQAVGDGSHAEGLSTRAEGKGAHAEGSNTQAINAYAHSEGEFTVANVRDQHVQGKYNKYVDSNNKALDYAHVVGNGTSNTARSNAYTLDWKGNAWFAGEVQCQYPDVNKFSATYFTQKGSAAPVYLGKTVGYLKYSEDANKFYVYIEYIDKNNNSFFAPIDTVFSSDTHHIICSIDDELIKTHYEAIADAGMHILSNGEVYIHNKEDFMLKEEFQLTNLTPIGFKFQIEIYYSGKEGNIKWQ